MTPGTADRGAEWAAGLFEGEGCISISRRSSQRFGTELGRMCVLLVLNGTDEEVVRCFHTIVGCGYVNESRYPERLGHKRQWRWNATSATDMRAAIELLRPYMFSRRGEKMDEALRILDLKATAGREAAHQTLLRTARRAAAHG